VVSATPIIEGQVLLSANGGNAGGLVRGIMPADLRVLPSIANNIRSGSLNDFHGTDSIVIGVTLAQRFGLGVGSRLTLISPDGAVTAFGTVPRVKSYRVVAVFDAGMNEYNSAYTFLPLEAAQIFFQKPDSVTEIQVMVKDPERVAAVSRAINTAMGSTPVHALDWTQSNDSFFAAVTVEQNVMFLILTLIILVAAFNVVSSLIMMVKDKTGDIAVLRTLGASRGAIMRIFLMCGASVGITGTVTGTVLGVVFCLNIERLRQWLQSATGTTLFDPEVYYLTHLPAKLEPATVVQVVLMALVLSLLATLYPSWRAARTDPVEALRHE
jgi:lipoprotein-releasing system permease protein